jgi:hypothetical protein
LDSVWVTDDFVLYQPQIAHVDIDFDALRIGLELEDADHFVDLLVHHEGHVDGLELIDSDSRIVQEIINQKLKKFATRGLKSLDLGNFQMYFTDSFPDLLQNKFTFSLWIGAKQIR